jgi:hypothetical protein
MRHRGLLAENKTAYDRFIGCKETSIWGKARPDR